MPHAILSIGLLLAADNLEAARTIPTYRILIALGLLVLFAGILSTLWLFQAPAFPTCKVSASCPTLYVEANIWMSLVV
jgi:hypothetical protein